MDDDTLMRGIQAGDESALSLLYDRYGGKFMNIVRWDIYTLDEAEDMVQEFFIEIWNKAKNYDPDKGTPLTWLYAVLRHRILDRIRRKQAYARRLERWSNECEQYSDSTQKEIMRNDTCALVHRALATLPRDQRACLKLTFVDEMSARQIGRATGLHYSTVRTRINLGKQKVKHFLLQEKAKIKRYL
jgi:RNA polymerase sigma-70 factor (ECF subfamily)